MISITSAVVSDYVMCERLKKNDIMLSEYKPGVPGPYIFSNLYSVLHFLISFDKFEVFQLSTMPTSFSFDPPTHYSLFYDKLSLFVYRMEIFLVVNHL